ncbi:MAG: hypothetical protein KDB23_00790 [Planctomycetales bacterium]|nr:hypothetical protein [Planctomycetales bacterium]
MLVSLVCCVTAATGHYLVLGLNRGVPGRAMFVIGVLVMPVVLVIGANLVRLALRRTRRR